MDLHISINILRAAAERRDQLSAINQKIKQRVGTAELISSLDMTTRLQAVVTPATDVERQPNWPLNK